MKQGTTEWIEARLGKVTASRMDDLLATTKTGHGAGRANYMAQLIAERLTGVSQDVYTNSAMQWGIEHEAEARAAYEFYSGTSVVETGFVLHPEIPESGASPDGLIGDDGLLEIKCPNTATHIETLLNRRISDKYLKQMLWQMECTGRKWCDFVSYDPRMPEKLRLYVDRVVLPESGVDHMRNEVKKFLTEMKDKIEKLEHLEPKTRIEF